VRILFRRTKAGGSSGVIYFLLLFFFERVGVFGAGVFGATGVFNSTWLRKRMKFALLKFRRRRAVALGVFTGGDRRTGRGGVSNAVATLFELGVRRGRGRLGALGVCFGMG
jgi:hypothetical protein